MLIHFLIAYPVQGNREPIAGQGNTLNWISVYYSVRAYMHACMHAILAPCVLLNSANLHATRIACRSTCHTDSMQTACSQSSGRIWPAPILEVQGNYAVHWPTLPTVVSFLKCVFYVLFLGVGLFTRNFLGEVSSVCLTADSSSHTVSLTFCSNSGWLHKRDRRTVGFSSFPQFFNEYVV